MNEYDAQFKKIVKKILDKNCSSNDRTGVGTIKIPSASITVDLADYKSEAGRVLPALSLRRVYPRVAFEELFWMLSGSTDARELQKKGIHIWDGNTSREFLDSRGLEHLREGFIGKGYGHQFRNFNGIDQLAAVHDMLINDPTSRRMLISLWNPRDLGETALPPCHLLYQFVTTGKTLNLVFYQRSSDIILAGSQNFMFAAFFLHFMAEVHGFEAGEVTHHIADCHIYNNLIPVADELLEREGKDEFATFTWDCPQKYYQPIDGAINRMSWYSVKVDYESDPAIDKNRLIMAV